MKVAFCMTAEQAIDYLRSHHLAGIVVQLGGENLDLAGTARAIRAESWPIARVSLMPAALTS